MKLCVLESFQYIYKSKSFYMIGKIKDKKKIQYAMGSGSFYWTIYFAYHSKHHQRQLTVSFVLCISSSVKWNRLPHWFFSSNNRGNSLLNKKTRFLFCEKIKNIPLGNNHPWSEANTQQKEYFAKLKFFRSLKNSSKSMKFRKVLYQYFGGGEVRKFGTVQ